MTGGFSTAYHEVIGVAPSSRPAAQWWWCCVWSYQEMISAPTRSRFILSALKSNVGDSSLVGSYLFNIIPDEYAFKIILIIWKSTLSNIIRVRMVLGIYAADIFISGAHYWATCCPLTKLFRLLFFPHVHMAKHHWDGGDPFVRGTCFSHSAKISTLRRI